jgi:hypothetical protein
MEGSQFAQRQETNFQKSADKRIQKIAVQASQAAAYVCDSHVASAAKQLPTGGGGRNPSDG